MKGDVFLTEIELFKKYLSLIHEIIVEEPAYENFLRRLFKTLRLPEDFLLITRSDGKILNVLDTKTLNDASLIKKNGFYELYYGKNKFTCCPLYKNEREYFICADNTQIEFLREISSRLKEILNIFNDLKFIKKRIYEDHLTKVRNRRALERDLQKDQKCCVIFIDIDRFKEINDRYGHAIGDKILIELGKLLKNNIREGDEVYRYGGDEFVLILKDTPETIARKIAGRLAERNR